MIAERESEVETALVNAVKACKGIAYKFTSPGRRNVPDRLVVLPKGVSFFVECKSTFGVVTKGQTREHERLRDQGQVVLVLRNSGKVFDVINEGVAGVSALRAAHGHTPYKAVNRGQDGE